MYIQKTLTELSEIIESGYLPVWVSAESQGEQLFPKLATVDLVYPSRLQDNKVLFIRVEITDTEQLQVLESITLQSSDKWQLQFSEYLENLTS